MTSAAGLTDPRLTEELTALLAKAAAAVRDIRRATPEARYKPDDSPVTAADEASEDILCEGLRRLLPGLTIISEEAAAKARPASVTSAFALVDPLDGTREFIAGRDEFTINLALIENGRPVVGLVSAPALDQIWRGVVGRGAERLQLAQKQIAPIRARAVDEQKLRALISRSHPDEKTAHWLNQYSSVELVFCGSALKFCRVAEGAADVYPRLAPTMEWDVAAGDAVLTAAGGTVTAPDGASLTYGALDRELRIRAFIAWGERSAGQRTA